MEILRQVARLAGRKNRQYETLTEENANGFKVRIWRAARTLDEAKAFDHNAMRQHMRKITQSLPREKWETALMALPAVACVAIVDREGDGVSVYPDWG